MITWGFFVDKILPTLTFVVTLIVAVSRPLLNIRREIIEMKFNIKEISMNGVSHSECHDKRKETYERFEEMKKELLDELRNGKG